MAENFTLARPYAEAVFALASESASLAVWAEVLASLAVVAADETMRECMLNPRLQNAQVTDLLVDAARVSLTTEQRGFVELLVENGRAALLPEIHSLFILRKNEVEGIKDAVVSSAFPIDEAMQKQLATDLEARFGSRLRISLTVDPELIGGVRVAVGDEVIDASVRGKLATMAAALKN